MATVQQSELVEFYEYLGKHLHAPYPHRTPEDLLDEWRRQHPDVRTHRENVAAIRAALRDMNAGDHGVDAEVFFRELDAEIIRRFGK